MIGKLTGTLLEKNPPQILIDCHGVGYEVDVPMSTFYNLPAGGREGVAADALRGARGRADPVRLRHRGRARGVPPAGQDQRHRPAHRAVGALGLSVAELAQAVTAQEAGRIVKVPGIGKKTAERLLLELKGKLGADLPLPGAAAAVGDAASDIQQALMALGYNEKDAAAALKALPAGVGVSEGIKLALKALAK
jgi:holliday junction DNA helicase RuvA